MGAWTLLTLADELPFGSSARRNSRVPKMLPHRFFPSADFCVWIDAKLQLQIQPHVAVERFLLTPSAEFAALPNLRRHTIDHEFAWITSWLCPPTREVPAACAAVREQWQHYAHEQRDSVGWQSKTVLIEGALLLLDLRSAATQCLLCNWFEEYTRFGERDQLSFSYVLHAQHSPPRVHLIPRRYHWSAALEEDTATCYNATATDAAELAVRYQHGLQGAFRAPRGRAQLAPRTMAARAATANSPAAH